MAHKKLYNTKKKITLFNVGREGSGEIMGKMPEVTQEEFWDNIFTN